LLVVHDPVYIKQLKSQLSPNSVIVKSPATMPTTTTTTTTTTMNTPSLIAVVVNPHTPIPSPNNNLIYTLHNHSTAPPNNGSTTNNNTGTLPKEEREPEFPSPIISPSSVRAALRAAGAVSQTFSQM
jgi:hypothetical protein